MVLNKRLWECSLALADALADAPSFWILGNAGMGALQVQLIFTYVVYISLKVRYKITRIVRFSSTGNYGLGSSRESEVSVRA